MRPTMLILSCLLFLALNTSSALATLPDPLQCTFDNCLGRSPKNSTAAPSAQYVYLGTLRTATGEPVANYPAAQVELEIESPCANPVVLNPDGPSDANGNIIWGVDTLNQGGGACEGPAIAAIRVNGNYFYTLDDVRSPDVDGDTFVALSDLQAWQVAFVSQAPTYVGDLDCDTFIALSDLSLWQKHFVAP